MALPEGQTVRLKQPTIEGPILDTRYNKDHGELEYLVSYTGADGDEASRWFLESQLEVVA